MKKWMVGAMLAMGMAACSSSASHDNVAACKDFLDAVQCGSVDISGSYNCDAYKNTTCDIAPYFDCLSEHYVCDNGTYDTAKLSTVSECASKATCK